MYSFYINGIYFQKYILCKFNMCFGDDNSESEQDSVDRSITKR